VDILADRYEAALLESWTDPDAASEEIATVKADDETEHTWFSVSRIGYDAEAIAIIQREPEVHWFG
jgi:hypothetical protein